MFTQKIAIDFHVVESKKKNHFNLLDSNFLRTFVVPFEKWNILASGYERGIYLVMCISSAG